MANDPVLLHEMVYGIAYFSPFYIWLGKVVTKHPPWKPLSGLVSSAGNMIWCLQEVDEWDAEGSNQQRRGIAYEGGRGSESSGQVNEISVE